MTFKTTAVIALALLMAACGSTKDPVHIEIVRNRTSPSLRGFASCSELEAQLKASLREELRIQLLMNQNSWGRGGIDDVAMESADADSAGSSNDAGSGREEGVDFSGTNNQEEGVDEADFVKTDGYNIYTLNGNRLEIFGVPEFGDLDHLSTTRIEGRPSQMLIHDDKLVVYSAISVWNLPEDHALREVVGRTYDDEYDYWYWRISNITKVTVIDMSDRTRPNVARELYMEGYSWPARLGGPS